MKRCGMRYGTAALLMAGLWGLSVPAVAKPGGGKTVEKPKPGKLAFVGDFETGDLSGWMTEIGRPDAVQVVTSPVRAGKFAARFDLRRDDPVVANGKRAEIKLAPEPRGLERWYGLSLYIPKDWVDDPSPEIVAQWHEIPDFHLGEDWRSPPLALTVRKDRFLVHRIWDPNPVTKNNTPGPGGGTEDCDLGPLKKGAWTDWVFHIKWSYLPDGLLQIWRDGKPVLEKRAPNTYNDESGNYFKCGIYKWEWKENPQRSITDHRVVFIDEVRIAENGARYEDVAPGRAS